MLYLDTIMRFTQNDLFRRSISNAILTDVASILCLCCISGLLEYRMSSNSLLPIVGVVLTAASLLLVQPDDLDFLARSYL